MISRYRDRRMEAIWDRQNQIILWRNVELAWLRQVSPEAAEALEADGSDDYPTAEAVADYETRTRHEFTAFLDAWVWGWSEQSLARRWVHFGLTSSDVIDTATALQLVRSHQLIEEASRDLRQAMSDVINHIADYQQVGRTHGQWAQPRQAYLPLYTLLSMLDRQASRLRFAGHELELADLSGPTGGREHTDDRRVIAALGSLGLTRAVASSQILPRDGWVHWAHIVSGLVTICEAIADHYWLLAQDGIDEVTVGQPSGSSAMPHKRNPALAENVRGLARLARALASTLDESMVQRGDRDLAHSSVERVALPDLCHLAMTTLKRTIEIVRTYQYDETVIRANCAVATVAGARSFEKVAEHVLAGATREEAMEMENPHD
jgi:adenylosuccinate lyase